jgi:hypothetical protein
MTISLLAIVNAALVVLTVAALAAVTRLGLRTHRTTNERSLVPAAPTPLRPEREPGRRAAA